MTDSEKLKAFKVRYNLNQEEVAKVLGFSSVRSIQYVESGERPLSGVAAKAIEYYDAVKQKERADK